jgi:hypothetical protein
MLGHDGEVPGGAITMCQATSWQQPLPLSSSPERSVRPRCCIRDGDGTAARPPGHRAR